MSTSRLSRFLVLSASLALAAPAAAPAAKPATFALSAEGIDGAPLLHARAGQVIRGAVQVRNLTRHPVTVRLQPADIRNAANGNADYVTTGLAAAGRWLRLATPATRLGAGATRRVAYAVRVPPNAAGASHYAGIVAVDTADLADTPARRRRSGRSFSFDRVNRQAMPLTVRLPGPLSHRLALRSVTLEVNPAGAGLVLGIAPEGTELTPATRVDLRVERGSRMIFTHHTTLGQLFPGDPLDYRIPWMGQPTEGSYHVEGVIRPEGAPAITIDRTVAFTSDTAGELERETTPGPAPPSLPLWVWLALAASGTLLLLALVAIWRLKRRPVGQFA